MKSETIGVFIEAKLSKNSIEVAVSEAQKIGSRIKAHSARLNQTEQDIFISILCLAIRSIVEDSPPEMREALFSKSRSAFEAIFSNGLSVLDSVPNAS